MTFKRITTTLLCAVIACFALSTAADAQQGMTYDEYKIKMAEYDKRTSKARLALAECKKMGETVDTEITALEKDVAAVNEEIYEVLGTDQSSIDGFLAELDRIEARLMGLLNFSDEALFDKRDEVNSMEDRSEEMKKDILAKEAVLSRNEEETVTEKKARAEEQDDMNAVVAKLEAIHASCDFLLKNHETRKKARSSEIEGLQKAISILSGANFGGLQIEEEGGVLRDAG